MEKLRITAHLKTPLIAQGYLTLDAILASVRFERCGDVEEAHATVPIKTEDGLFHASAAVVNSQGEGKVSFAASLRASHDLSPDWIRKKKPSKKKPDAKPALYKKLGTKRRRDYGSVMNSYSTISTPTVSWICEGNPEEIVDLLRDVPFMGTKRAQGYGEIQDWEIEETDECPLIAQDGSPMRPIPEAMFKGDRDYPLQDTGWRPAYWNPANRALCYAPMGLLT